MLFKNEPPPGSDYFAPVEQTHNLLRVMESIRAAEGETSDAVFRFYWAAGSAIHHGKTLDTPVAELLDTAGVDASHAAAYDDESWDKQIRTRMDAGLALVGDDVGTPIIAFSPEGQDKIGIFGPVISRVPEGPAALELWDAMITMSLNPGFWELKRTRSEGPKFGDAPVF